MLRFSFNASTALIAALALAPIPAHGQTALSAADFCIEREVGDLARKKFAGSEDNHVIALGKIATGCERSTGTQRQAYKSSAEIRHSVGTRFLVRPR